MRTSYKKRIARNAFFLYARKGFSILVGLYTSRLLLERLGYDDFGLYNVIGSIVVMFNAFRYLFSDSIQRYINTAKGKGDISAINKIFSIGVNIHLALSILFIIVVEIGGLLILPHLKTGNASTFEVQIIFQSSLFSAIVTLMTVPYDALIIANERFNAYALFSIIEVILKLVLVFCLVFFTSNRVIWYAIFIFLILLLIRCINAIYCKYNFKSEAVYVNVKDRALMVEISKFAIWNFVGNIGYWLTFSGLDFILNHFGGLVISASKSIANQVFYNFQQFIGDLNTSFRPRCMMLYSSGDINGYYQLMFLNTKTNFFVCSLLCFIFILFAPEILQLWLSSVPPDTVIFCQTILLYSLIRCLRGPLDIYFKTIGKLKTYQLSECILTLLNIPISIIVLSLGAKLYSVFIIMCILEAINYLNIIIIATKKYDFIGVVFYQLIITRILLGTFVGLILFELFHYLKSFATDTIYLCILFFCSFFCILLSEFYILFTHNEKLKILSIIKK